MIKFFLTFILCLQLYVVLVSDDGPGCRRRIFRVFKGWKMSSGPRVAIEDLRSRNLSQCYLVPSFSLFYRSIFALPYKLLRTILFYLILIFLGNFIYLFIYIPYFIHIFFLLLYGFIKLRSSLENHFLPRNNDKLFLLLSFVVS